ncbi:MAG: hypothetical protein CM15mP120_12390 [Pseudomonadota bacterium]|nr:MAG: hypothetical protein CM15mP120_12390 [Pseudomonadota bacterium]
MNREKRHTFCLATLQSREPGQAVELNFDSPFELLIAVMLSMTTDISVSLRPPVRCLQSQYPGRDPRAWFGEVQRPH